MAKEAELRGVYSEIDALGTALAVCISWSVNHSLLWAILQGCFGWFYVIYYALSR